MKWQKVIVEEEYMSTQRISELITIKASKITCGATCSEKKWCHTWCSKNADTCHLSNLIVSPSYVISGSSPLECFITTRVDIAVDSVAYAAPPYNSEYDVASLTDGIFSNEYGSSYISEDTANAWILFDLEKEASISEIRFYPPESDYYGRFYCSDIEIRLGSSLILNGDFSSFLFFGKQDGGCIPFEINRITADSPVNGRYVAFFRKELVYRPFSIWMFEVEGYFLE